MRFFALSISLLLLLGCQPAADEQKSTASSEVAAELAGNTPVQPEAYTFVEGKDYRVLESTLEVAEFEPEVSDNGFIMEFLWPGCPHCQDFNPTVIAYGMENPGVTIIKRAAPANERWALDARVFYALRGLGHTLDDELIHYYESVRVNQNRLPDQEDINTFLEQHNVDPQAFQAAYEDQGITDKLRVILQDMMAADITSVPTLVVNGQYVVSAPAPHAPEDAQRYFALLDYLLTL
ncbi:Thiol:disulfide interchange protein DsbA [Pseudidiomarina piscicola]|uniref:Thiol:disulfide interchange protein DsbA n=1 Tax=Pseudidiomarina piscicola TaxID=2614830 RepID=A0A6S6WUE7_9GAMM|nr:thioredoxin domain-containing protein [Pseudidiomarina piscicola]CAB0150787.1 Thiol:disulfide interchange protein DsbA [Pseudidiomarina piscicola]VZT40291.1 Thiol:disulfide interchange protein DsbA [Pseudomonas aeruginosa]